MFCQNCGAKVKDDAVFCSSCGKRIGANPEVPLQADAPITNIVENRVENKPDNVLQGNEQPESEPSSTTKGSIQEPKDLPDIIGTQYSLTWKSYSLTRFPLSIFLYENMTKTLELKEEKIDVIGPEPWLGKQKLLDSISYSDIASVDCKVVPANTAIGWVFTALSILLAFILLVGSEITVFSVVLGILFIYVIPCYSRSTRKPVCLTITEKNGKKIKFKGEKAYIQVATDAAAAINALISK